MQNQLLLNAIVSQCAAICTKGDGWVMLTTEHDGQVGMFEFLNSIPCKDEPLLISPSNGVAFTSEVKCKSLVHVINLDFV